MKTKYYLSLLVFALFSCEKQQDNLKFDLKFENQTDVTINVSNEYGDFESFSINSGEIKTVKSTDGWFDYTHSLTDKVIAYKHISNNYILFYQYNFKVQYKISGTASKVDVTLSNSSGGTSQYSNVTLPVTYDFKTFSDSFVYIQAQNKGTTGSVTVEIFYMGELLKSSTSYGEYVIATASGSI